MDFPFIETMPPETQPIIDAINDSATSQNETITIFGAIIIGLIIGYIAVKGMFDPWK